MSKTLVEGEEEYSSVHVEAVSMPIFVKSVWPAECQKTPYESSKGKRLGTLNMTPPTPSAAMPLEYSPVRHRSAIERVLSALQGADPMLDSATKVWTTFAVAKNFEITHSPLEDYIIRWLRAYPNSYFLEVLPEVSHKIADGLENYDLARDSFAILVGEEALDSLRHNRETWVHKRTTFGRKKEDLPEHIRTRIEYASKSFLERINNDFANFVVNGMQWIEELPEVRRLSSYTEPEIQDTVQKLRDLLKHYVQGAIYKVLCVDYDTVPGPDLHHEGGNDLLPRLDRAAVWANLPLGERILSRTYWEALRSCATLQGCSNLDLKYGWNLKGGPDRLSHIEKRELDRGTYRKIENWELRALIRNGQTRLDQKQPGDLLSTFTSHREFHNAQLEANIAPSPTRSYALPYRTRHGAAQCTDTTNTLTSSIPTQPIDVPKSLKRTEKIHDAFSPLNDKQSNTRLRTKWPFGAPRDDPAAQVEKSGDSLHILSLPSDRWPAVDNAFEEVARHGRQKDEVSTRVDPWRGYSEHLGQANVMLQNLAPMTPKVHLTPTEATNKNGVPLAGSDDCADWSESDGDDGVRHQYEDSKLERSYQVPKFFDLGKFFNQARIYIGNIASHKLRSSDSGCLRESLDLGIVNTLVCLEDSEWKYLPLWAGGNDDGSMGVYSDDLPTAEHGFTTAGPEVHDGSTPANSVKTPSEFEFVTAEDSASTFNASTATNRGFSDTVRRGHVHAADSTDDSMSDSFTMMTPSVDSDDEEASARKQIEAQERIEEAEEAVLNETRWIEKGKEKMVAEDESYADLFSGEIEEDGDDTDRAEFNDEEEEEDLVMV